MTAVALDAFPQFETNGGLPLAGGRLYAYQAGTLIPLDTWTDRSATVPNANPVVLDSAGRANVWLTVNAFYKLILQDSAGNVIWSVDEFCAGADPAQLTAAGIVPSTGGTYTGLVSFTGGATFDGTPAQDLATLDSLGISAVQNQNLFLNSDFRTMTGAPGSFADGTSLFSSTSALCDTGSVTLAQLAQPQNGIPYASRTTQPDVAAKRIGFAQRVTSPNTYFYRGKSLALSAKVRCSISTTIRCALVAWTGTADTAPADVVNNWASTTYTAGNFFIANTLPIAVTATAVTAATFTDILASSASGGGVVVPNTTTQLYMVVWTDLPVAQNVTLDASCVECGVGNSAQIWSPNYATAEGRFNGFRVFTANGTYTPTAGTTRIFVRAVGGGGAGGGSNNVTAGNQSIGAGGGAGAYVEAFLGSGFAGGAVVIGAGGASAPAAAGGNGGGTTFAGLVTAPGGFGGAFFVNSPVNLAVGGNGGGASGVGLAIAGMSGNSAGGAFAGGIAISGQGASGPFGGGGQSAISGGGAVAGNAGTGYGSGGSGAAAHNAGANTGGGAGAPGVLIIYEYT